MIITKDSTQSFSGLADRYTIGRPMYADELIHTLYSDYRFSEQSIIADIGCGTGKFAQQLLEKGSLVYGVEPNDDMRNTAVAELKQYKKFRAVKGTAADTKAYSSEISYPCGDSFFCGKFESLIRAECSLELVVYAV